MSQHWPQHILVTGLYHDDKRGAYDGDVITTVEEPGPGMWAKNN